MIDGMGGQPSGHRAAAARRVCGVIGTRQQGRAASSREEARQAGRGFIREFKTVDERWESTRESLYEAIDRGGSASQLAHAAERGALVFDSLGHDDGADFTEGVLANWIDKVDEAVLDPTPGSSYLTRR